MFALNFNFRFFALTLALIVNFSAVAEEVPPVCPEVQVYGHLQFQKDELVLVLNDKTEKRQAYRVELYNLSEAANFFTLQDQYVVATVDSLNPQRKTVHVSSMKLSRKDYLNPQGPQQVNLSAAFDCQNKRSLASEKKKNK